MIKADFKQIAFVSLLGSALFVSGATAQDNACPLNVRVYSFVEGTTKTNPIDGAEIKLTDPKTNKTHQYTTTANGEIKVDGLAQSNFEISVTKAGFRRSIDSVNYDCSQAVITPEGIRIVGASVIMWEGDPSKTITFTQIDQPAYKVGDAPKDAAAGKFQIEPAGAVSYPRTDVLNGHAVLLAKPSYPASAKMVGAAGAVKVQVTIDEEGYIVAAKGIEGHPLLRMASAQAARASRFKPTTLQGKPVKVSGIIIYNFQ